MIYKVQELNGKSSAITIEDSTTNAFNTIIERFKKDKVKQYPADAVRLYRNYRSKRRGKGNKHIKLVLEDSILRDDLIIWEV